MRSTGVDSRGGASASRMQGAECKHEMTLVTCTWGNGRCYRPTLCTHDPARDFVSGVLHKEGSFGTIRDLEMVCASGLVTCDSGRTFVDCGAALGHLTVAAASFGMTGAAYVGWAQSCRPQVAYTLVRKRAACWHASHGT